MRKFIFLFISLLSISTGLLAQRVVSGNVIDNNGLPVAGASVVSKKTGKGAITDNNGYFRLQAAVDDELQISIIGYVTQTVSASSNDVKVSLAEDVSGLSEVVMVGTRRIGRTKTNTTAPVDVINVAQATAPTGRMDLTAVLNYLAPSFNYNKQSGSDGADHVDLATLRGLGPDQTLVLVNGKRLHQTAFVAVFGTRGRGNSGTDLNTIPSAAIERVEILRDGASAQYGSDAIAGVMNLVLKKSTNNVTGSFGWSAYNDPKFNTAFARKFYSQYEHGRDMDGLSFGGDVNFGVPVGKYGGFVNLTFEGLSTGKTFRQAKDTTNYHNDDKTLPLNIYRRGNGDAGLNKVAAFYNSEFPAKNGTTFYTSGGYTHKATDAYAFTRNFSARPDRFPTDNFGNLIYVKEIMRKSNDGEVWYSPHIQTNINDYTFTGGLKGKAKRNWNWDVSNTIGRNNFHFFGDKTFNASKGPGQTHFDDGGFSFLQNTANADVTKQFKKIHLAVGGEYRYENYKIYSGEPGSYLNYNPNKATGSQGFPGYQPRDVINAKRHVWGAYADAEIDATDAFLVDLAVRVEDYSDFGFTDNFKVAARYKASDKVNVRGSVSTGFRAPSLQQINFSSTFTTVQAGNIEEVVIAPNYSSLAHAAGIPDLKQEKSLNAGLGFTWKATPNMNVTLDGYYIKVKDRVVLSGQFDGSDPNLDAGLRNQMAALNVSLAQFFANAVNTNNAGADLVIDYNKRLNKNHKIKCQFAGNFQNMKIDQINVPPKLSGSTFLKQTFLSDREQAFILASAPKMKMALNFEYGIKRVTLGTRVTYFGKITLLGYGQDGLGIMPTVPLDNGSGDVPDQYNYSGKIVPDLYVGFPMAKNFTVYFGADNILNTHPDFGVVKGAKDWAYNTETGGAWDAVQMGSNGRRFFIRVGFSL